MLTAWQSTFRTLAAGSFGRKIVMFMWWDPVIRRLAGARRVIRPGAGRVAAGHLR